MKHRFASVLGALLCVLFFVAADPLHNSSWNVTFTSDREKEFKDVLLFKGDQLTSSAWKKKGFDSSQYDADTRGITVLTFNAESKSDKAGSLKWQGTISVQEISGEVVWTKKDGTEVRYAFKGTKAGS